MSMKMMDREKLENMVGVDQRHLLQFWDKLNEQERESLCRQIETINIPRAVKAFTDSAEPLAISNISAIDSDHFAVAMDQSVDDLRRYWETGLKAIAAGEVGVVVLAGGQATRLGAVLPKGTLPLELESARSLLDLQAARIARLQHLSHQLTGNKGEIVWYVMTSASTEAETKSHLIEVISSRHLNPDQVHVFSQGEMPAFDLEGAILLSKGHSIATAPDGNGGLYRVIGPQLAQHYSSRVKYLHVYCVDNVLCRIADPHFIGFCIEKGADCAAKVVEKVEPNEAVGVICRVDGRVTVLEYSELPMELGSRRDSITGALYLRAGNIANHFFTTEFVRSLGDEPGIPFHRAVKKIPYMDRDGTLQTPSKPNGIKLEQFVFDVFRFSKSFFVWQVCREQEFSPLKNAESVGRDCLSTCRHDLFVEYIRWLRAVGVVMKGDEQVEIDPNLSYNGEDLEKFAGQKIDSLTFLK